jgi:RHS repeat-associated protein
VSRIHTFTDGRGVVQTFTYDALDHITRIDYHDPSGQITDGVPSISYGHDPDGNVISRSETSDNTNYTYDDLNRMIKQSPASPAAETDYTYDLAGNLASSQVSDQPAPVSYGYDNLNRVTSVTDQNGKTQTFGYNNVDQRTTTTYSDGVTQKATYDISHRMTCIYAYTGTPPATGSNGCPSPSTSLLTFQSYGYTSPAGLDTATRYKMTDRNGHVTTYTYDGVGRLTEARTTSGSTVLSDYQYTLGGHNVISRQTVTGTDVPNSTTSYVHFANNAPCWSAPGAVTGSCSAPPAGATTYSYDNAGNLTSTSDGLSATYNLQGQNSQLTPPGGQPLDMSYVDATSDQRTDAGDLRYSYDLTGLNTQGTNNGVPHTDWFVRDPAGTLVARRDSNSNNSNTRDLFYLYDAQGSVIATAGNTGNVVHHYTYDPYGQETGADPADDNPWRYISGYADTATGMTKFGTRYYQPNLMNWTQPDPNGGNPAGPMTLNPYAYVGNSPVIYIDPTGRQSSNASLCFIICISFASGVSATGSSFSIGVGLGSPGISLGYNPSGTEAPGGVSAEYECGAGPFISSYNTTGEYGAGVGIPSAETPECSATSYGTADFPW